MWLLFYVVYFVGMFYAAVHDDLRAAIIDHVRTLF
jgi:hypothetical protein